MDQKGNSGSWHGLPLKSMCYDKMEQDTKQSSTYEICTTVSDKGRGVNGVMSQEMKGKILRWSGHETKDRNGKLKSMIFREWVQEGDTGRWNRWVCEKEMRLLNKVRAVWMKKVY